MTAQRCVPHRPLLESGQAMGLALLVLGGLLTAALFVAAEPVGVTSTYTARVSASASEVLVSRQLTSPPPTPGAHCTVTGDLAGNANPAEIWAILCGSEPR